ncbi:MAG TPA: xanthine dehydrogenase family protein molybdopterin-binding subunit [Ignavibacteriales bacterium]|nr:xanthine dehydrogenase family protein molybdopterin-binding subunit [Ignavibacteriales bacterium]HOL80784.1 xanthine dehydrogenase family protein molybdopterin-binding subunit [Ignavibacteriales bacterium]HPP33220.1 xanthine dehydrogenase family protein molybdopterin-binding subunit [Ignavibacteriales bacterium]
MVKNNNFVRNDAYAKVTGRAKFTDDLKFHNMLHAIPVYSDYVHAKILKIDTSRAEKQPGVVKVLTYKDVLGSNRFGQIIKDYHIFADDKIRYNGDVIAVIVAETRQQAIDAASFIEIEVEELPKLLDPEIAIDSKILVHEEHGSNLINEHRVLTGDADKAFEECDYIIEHTFTTQHIEHSYLEPESAICIPRSDGVFEIRGSMQHPFSTRRFVANLLGVRLADVEVIGTFMGGGFGGKDDTAAIVCARAALAAKLTNRPVKITYAREWSFRESYKRHPYKVYYKMGITKEGIWKAAKIKIIADGGAYCSVTPWVTWRSTVQCCGPYVVENVNCLTLGVYTNNVFTGAMRGFGSPQMNFVVEQMVEIAAEKCGIDPIEFRRKNIVKQDSITITQQKLDKHIVSMEQVMDSVIKEINYFEKLQNCSYGKSEGDELYGIGLAISYRGMSLGAEGTDFCAAIVNVQADGSVVLETGMHENGQGLESAMILILSEQLGIDISRIRYRRSSTSVIPDSGTTVASRGTIVAGGAIVEAVKILKRKFMNVIAPILEATIDDVEFKDNYIYAKNGKFISFDDAVKKMFANQEYPNALGIFKAPRVSWDEHTGHGDAYFTWTYSSQAVELVVNKKTGKVKLLNAVAAHDVGKVINEKMALGQVYGGVAMSTGYALFEKLDIQDGVIKSLNFDKYHIPRANDMPEIKAILIENFDPNTGTGAKGMGEPTNELFAPAIANAIYRATGKRYFNLPIKISNV